jgi:hypothetical protein
LLDLSHAPPGITGGVACACGAITPTFAAGSRAREGRARSPADVRGSTGATGGRLGSGRSCRRPRSHQLRVPRLRCQPQGVCRIVPRPSLPLLRGRLVSAGRLVVLA